MKSSRGSGQLKTDQPRLALDFPNFARAREERGKGGGSSCFGSEGEREVKWELNEGLGGGNEGEGRKERGRRGVFTFS